VTYGQAPNGPLRSLCACAKAAQPNGGGLEFTSCILVNWILPYHFVLHYARWDNPETHLCQTLTLDHIEFPKNPQDRGALIEDVMACILPQITLP
jgi:hypothetical protein